MYVYGWLLFYLNTKYDRIKIKLYCIRYFLSYKMRNKLSI